MGSTMKIDKTKLGSNKPGVDDYFKQMFGASQSDIQYIEIAKLTPFDGQPFKPYSEDKLRELAEDIAEHGILSPLLVRPHDGTYQIMAGHNRANAAKLAGLNTVPCLVKTVDDDTAKIIMLNTNLNQRDELLPSEKAFAYKMQLDTIKRQGQRTDLMHNVQKVDSLAQIGFQNKDSRRNTAYFIRLTYLIPVLLDMVDSKRVPFRAGVSLSYCYTEDQQRLLAFMAAHKIETVTLDQAEQIKSLGVVTDESLYGIFGIKAPGSTAPKPPKAKTVSLKIPAEFFGGQLPKVKADDELLRRIAETIQQYCEENR